MHQRSPIGAPSSSSSRARDAPSTRWWPPTVEAGCSRLAGDRVLRPGADEFTLAEVAVQLNADEGFVRQLWRALGLPRSEADAGVASQQDIDALGPIVITASVVGEEPVLDLARSVSAGLARIAEASNATGRRLSPAGSIATSSEMETAVYWALNAPIVRALGATLAACYPYHFEAARDHFERSDSFDVMLRGHIRLGVGFVDVTGFTTMAEHLGEVEFDQLITSFSTTVSDTVHELGGRVVKYIGDAAMIVAPNPVLLTEIAAELVWGATLAGLGLTLHAGLAHGELLGRDGDYFGSPVNVAARLASLAEPGMILATESVGTAIANAGKSVQWFEPREVRGLPAPIVTCVVGRPSGPSQPPPIELPLHGLWRSLVERA